MATSVQASNKSTTRWASKSELLNFICLLSDFELQQRGSRHLPGHLVRQVCPQFVKGVGGRIFNNSNRQQRCFLTGSNPSGEKAKNKLATYLILACYKHTVWLSNRMDHSQLTDTIPVSSWFEIKLNQMLVLRHRPTLGKLTGWQAALFSAQQQLNQAPPRTSPSSSHLFIFSWALPWSMQR